MVVWRDDEGWLLKALRESANSFLLEFDGLTEDELRWCGQGGEWSLKQTAAHVRDAEELGLAQLTSFIDGDAIALPFWEIEVLPLERDYQRVNLRTVLSEFRQLRTQSVDRLLYLRPWDWKRSREHPYRGPLTLRQMIGELASHDLEHLSEVRRLKGQIAALRSQERTDPFA